MVDRIITSDSSIMQFNKLWKDTFDEIRRIVMLNYNRIDFFPGYDWEKIRVDHIVIRSDDNCSLAFYQDEMLIAQYSIHTKFPFVDSLDLLKHLEDMADRNQILI